MGLRIPQGFTLMLALLAFLLLVHAGDPMTRIHVQGGRGGGLDDLEDEAEASTPVCLPDQMCTEGLTVFFGGRKEFESGIEVMCGQLLDDSQVTNVPAMYLHQEDEDLETTATQHGLLVMLLDPDAPSRYDCPSHYWIHWMAQFSLQFGVLRLRKRLLEYLPPSPPDGTGKHRYQLLLFQLKNDIPITSLPRTRSHFDLEKFLMDVGVGDKVASFQFLIE